MEPHANFYVIGPYREAFFSFWRFATQLKMGTKPFSTVKKKAMFQTKVCTKVGNSLFLNLVMIRKWTLFSVKMVNFQNAEMKFIFSWLGFKSKVMCLHELGDNGYECNKQTTK